MNKKAKRAFSI